MSFDHDHLDLEVRLDRLEEAVLTMASWLVQAQTGFGAQDARGIEKIVRGERSGDAETISRLEGES